MKTSLRIFLYLIGCTFLMGQNRDKNVDVGAEFREMINQLDKCIDTPGEDCLGICNRLITKGKKEKIDFLDYLYFKKSVYFIHRNEIDSAMLYAKLSLKHPHPVEKQRRDLDAYNAIANCYYYKGKSDSAIYYYHKVAKILEDGGNPLHLGYLYSNMATLLGELGNDDKQIEYLLKSYKLLKDNGDKDYISTVASNLSLGYYYKKDTIKTKDWALHALSLAEFNNDLIAKSQSNITLSLIQKDLNKALEYAEQGVIFSDLLADKIKMASSYYRYAEVLDKLGQNEKALEYGRQAVIFAEEVGDKNTLMRASYTVARIFYNQGMKEKSADYFHTYSTYKDSISSIENVREINELNTKYETEKKEKQIAEQDLKIQKQRANLLYAILGGALLVSILGGIFLFNRKAQKLKLKQVQQEKENAILNSFIQGEERERNRISYELHDGVAAMIGAAKMSLETIPHLPPEKQTEQLSKVKEILENTHADVRHIAHNLLPTVLENEGIIKATQQFVSEINQTQLIHISVVDNQSKADELSKQLQLMLFRIIQELINNTIKHSQAQNAIINFSRHQNELQIEVSDDGIGYDGDLNSGNQGLYSISQRLKSIGGNFKFIKKNDKGMQAIAELKV